MRPVNLIPADQRRGQHAPARTGRFTPYLVVGVLVAALVGVTSLVLTDNRIADREAEAADLSAHLAELESKAQRLASYTTFHTVREQRMATIASLANSRFDWERVLRELALVLPHDVWLVNVSGSVSPAVTVTDSAEISARDSAAGPALEIIGCAPSQESVARFVAVLEDIDGVTRVGVATSKRPDLAAVNSSASAAQDDDCRTRDFIARFEIVVAFDAVPAPGTTAPVPATPTPTVPTSADGSQVADAEQQEAAGRESAQTQTAKARRAVETFTP